MRNSRFLKVAGLIALLVAPLAQAQESAAPWTVDGAVQVPWTRYSILFNEDEAGLNVPSTIAASTTATNSFILDVRNVDTARFFLQASLTLTNPAAAALVLPYQLSLDGTNFTSNAGSIALTLTGTQTVNTSTNVNFENWGFLKVTGFQNTGTNSIATNSIKLRIYSSPTTTYTRSR